MRADSHLGFIADSGRSRGLWAIVAYDLSETRAKTTADEYARQASEHGAVAMGYVALPEGEAPAGWDRGPSADQGVDVVAARSAYDRATAVGTGSDREP